MKLPGNKHRVGDAGVMALLDAGFDLVQVDATEVYLSQSRRQVMYR